MGKDLVHICDRRRRPVFVRDLEGPERGSVRNQGNELFGSERDFAKAETLEAGFVLEAERCSVALSATCHARRKETELVAVCQRQSIEKLVQPL